MPRRFMKIRKIGTSEQYDCPKCDKVCTFRNIAQRNKWLAMHMKMVHNQDVKSLDIDNKRGHRLKDTTGQYVFIDELTVAAARSNIASSAWR